MNTQTTYGLSAARYLRALVISKNDPIGAIAIASGQNWSDSAKVLTALKAATEALDSTQAAAMIAPVGYDFVQFVRPMSIVARLTAVRRAPPRTRLVGQTAGARASWVGESAPKPLSTSSFTTGMTLTPRKVEASSVVSVELTRVADVNAERFLLADLARACAEAVDTAFLDVSNDGSADDRPASVTNGGPTFASTGSSLAAVDADLKLAINLLTENGSTLEDATFVLTPKAAAHIASLRGTDGAPAFPGMGAKGGSIFGITAITSGSIATPSSPTESQITLLDQDAILLADESEAILTVGRHASLQMSDTPAGGATQLVSLWQHGLSALRTERFISWAPRRTGAAVTVTQVQY